MSDTAVRSTAPPVEVSDLDRLLLTHLVNGHTYATIAATLDRSFHTINKAIHRLYTTHQLDDRHHAMVWAVHHGLVPPPDTAVYHQPPPRRPPSPRQAAVLLQLVRGRGNSDTVASALGLARETVNTHIVALLRLHQVPCRTTLALYALRHRLIDPESGALRYGHTPDHARAAHYLFTVLDGIAVLDDLAGADDARFRQQVRLLAAKRFEIARVDADGRLVAFL